MRDGFVGPHVRVSTGIDGLDEMLGGGLLPGRPYLLVGPPGSGKTTMALQFLLKGVRQGEEVLFVTLDEPPNELRLNFRGFPRELDKIWVFDAIPDVMRYEKHPFKDIATVRSAQQLGKIPLGMRQTDEFRSVEIAFSALMQAMKMESVKRLYGRLVVDSLTALKFFGMKGFDDTQGAQVFLRFLSELKITALLTLEEAPTEEILPERMLSRGEIHLYSWESESMRLKAVCIEKFRGSPHDSHLHPYRITSHGVDIDTSVSISKDTRELLPMPQVVGPVMAKPTESELTLEAEWSLLTLLDDVKELVDLGIDADPVRARLQQAHSNLSEMKLEDTFKVLLEARQMVNHLILSHQVTQEFKEKGGGLVALKRSMTGERKMTELAHGGTQRGDLNAMFPLLNRLVMMLSTTKNKAMTDNLSPELLQRVAKTMIAGSQAAAGIPSGQPGPGAVTASPKSAAPATPGVVPAQPALKTSTPPGVAKPAAPGSAPGVEKSMEVPVKPSSPLGVARPVTPASVSAAGKTAEAPVKLPTQPLTKPPQIPSPAGRTPPASSQSAAAVPRVPGLPRWPGQPPPKQSVPGPSPTSRVTIPPPPKSTPEPTPTGSGAVRPPLVRDVPKPPPPVPDKLTPSPAPPDQEPSPRTVEPKPETGRSEPPPVSRETVRTDSPAREGTPSQEPSSPRGPPSSGSTRPPPVRVPLIPPPPQREEPAAAPAAAPPSEPEPETPEKPVEVETEPLPVVAAANSPPAESPLAVEEKFPAPTQTRESEVDREEMSPTSPPPSTGGPTAMAGDSGSSPTVSAAEPREEPVIATAKVEMIDVPTPTPPVPAESERELTPDSKLPAEPLPAPAVPAPIPIETDRAPPDIEPSPVPPPQESPARDAGSPPGTGTTQVSEPSPPTPPSPEVVATPVPLSPPPSGEEAHPAPSPPASSVEEDAEKAKPAASPASVEPVSLAPEVMEHQEPKIVAEPGGAEGSPVQTTLEGPPAEAGAESHPRVHRTTAGKAAGKPAAGAKARTTTPHRKKTKVVSVPPPPTPTGGEIPATSADAVPVRAEAAAVPEPGTPSLPVKKAPAKKRVPKATGSRKRTRKTAEPGTPESPGTGGQEPPAQGPSEPAASGEGSGGSPPATERGEGKGAEEGPSGKDTPPPAQDPPAPEAPNEGTGEERRP